MQEDLAFRYLAGGLRPEHKTLSEFWRRHGEAIEELFTQVLGWARKAGMVRLGRVAIDATRIKANASPDRLEKQERQQVRRWRREMESADPDQEPGMEVEGKRRTLAPANEQAAGDGLSEQVLADGSGCALFARTRGEIWLEL